MSVDESFDGADEEETVLWSEPAIPVWLDSKLILVDANERPANDCVLWTSVAIPSNHNVIQEVHDRMKIKGLH